MYNVERWCSMILMHKILRCFTNKLMNKQGNFKIMLFKIIIKFHIFIILRITPIIAT